jgi:hypothetical protein
MNCPNCKNPISANSITCEWCGTKLLNNEIEEASNVKRINKTTNWNELSSGRKAIIIVFAILLFLFIYFQINPIT